MPSPRATAMPILPLLLGFLALTFAVMAAGPPAKPRPGASVEVVRSVHP